MTTPIYIAEVAKPDMRGTLVTINGLLICFGQFTAGMIDGIFDQIDPENGWRYMLGLSGVPSIIMFIGFLFLPESPRWLVMVGREDEALSVLESVRETKRESTHELQEIIEVCSVLQGSLSRANTLLVSEYGNDEDEEKDVDDSDKASNQDIEDVPEGCMDRILTFIEPFTNLISHAPTKRAMILGCGIMILQQLSGINTVMYYAASIYEASGYDGEYFIFLIIFGSIFVETMFLMNECFVT